MASLLSPPPNLLQLLAAPVPARPWCSELTFWDPEEQPCQQGREQLGIQPPQPGIQPPQLGIQPPQLGIQPPQLGIQLSQPGIQTPQPGIQPPQPGIQPPQPGIQPPAQPLMPNNSRSTMTTVGRTGVQIRPWAWETDGDRG